MWRCPGVPTQHLYCQCRENCHHFYFLLHDIYIKFYFTQCFTLMATVINYISICKWCLSIFKHHDVTCIWIVMKQLHVPSLPLVAHKLLLLLNPTINSLLCNHLSYVHVHTYIYTGCTWCKDIRMIQWSAYA